MSPAPRRLNEPSWTHAAHRGVQAENPGGRRAGSSRAGGAAQNHPPAGRAAGVGWLRLSGRSPDLECPARGLPGVQPGRRGRPALPWRGPPGPGCFHLADQKPIDHQCRHDLDGRRFCRSGHRRPAGRTRTYASNSGGIQVCTYPCAPLAFVALCPWIFGRAFARPLAGISLVAAVCLQWIVLVYLINGGFTRTSSSSILSSMIWAVVAYAGGKVVARLTGVVRRGEMQAQQQKTEEFFDFLHSHIKAGLAAIKLEQPDVPAMLEKVGELERAVSEQRLAQMLSMDRVPVAMLCSERIRAFTGVIHVAETPRTGARTVRGPVGKLIPRPGGSLEERGPAWRDDRVGAHDAAGWHAGAGSSRRRTGLR